MQFFFVILANYLIPIQRLIQIIYKMSGVISIEGNLGAGKSTLLSTMNVDVIKEPVDEWENLSGGNILEKYYQDPKRWAFTFQLNALHSRSLLWSKAILDKPNSFHFSERSPLADRYIFGQIMARQGNFEPTQYQIYDAICKSLISTCPIKAIIYLKCPPQVCLERIKKRARKGQEGITLQYLKKVHERHEDWIGRKKSQYQVLVIDTSQFDVSQDQYKQQVVGKILTFINQLSRN